MLDTLSEPILELSRIVFMSQSLGSSGGQIVPDTQGIDESSVGDVPLVLGHKETPPFQMAVVCCSRMLLIRLDPNLQLEASAQQWILRLRYLREMKTS